MSKILNLSAILLAAGHGTRMRSDTPKVLHKIAGFSMLEHITSIISSIPDNNIDIQLSNLVIVTSKDLEEHPEFQQILQTYGGITTVQQEYKLGTGHAVYKGLSGIHSSSDLVLIMYCDAPMITLESILKLIKYIQESKLDIVGSAFDYNGIKPYGRFELDSNGKVKRVIEAADIAALNPTLTNLCNAGMLIAKQNVLRKSLEQKCSQIDLNHFTQEIYLTDIFESSNSGFLKITEEEAMGVNTRTELAAAEAVFQNRIRDKMMKRGISLIAPETVFFSADTTIKHDTIIHPYVNFGIDVAIGYGCEIKSFCEIEGTTIGNKAIIGPFARLRPNTQLDDNCKIGNFVELKNAYLSNGVKASHLTYLGDVHIGSNTNIGAGAIICNYDGINKHHTTIGADVQIGANSSIISPRYIGDSAKIAAGSVITDDVQDDHIAIARVPQISKPRRKKIPS